MVCNYFAVCQPIYNTQLFQKGCWGNGEDCKVFAYLQQHLRKLRPIDGYYYDLIRVPHGHIPVPKANLWSHLPLPIKEFRDECYYRCPSCGEPSFFKIQYVCDECFEDLDDIEQYYYKCFRVRMERRDYFRSFWKRIEYLLLPILVLTGKAWYVLASSRLSISVKRMRKFSKDC
jgi:hypothetical protein